MIDKKTRVDAWDSELTDEARWEIYERTKRLNFPEVSKWLGEEYSITVSRSAYYRFIARMREDEFAHKLDLAASAASEAAKMAGNVRCADEATIEAYKSLAADAALRSGDAVEANRWIQAAMSIQDRLLKRQEIDLKIQAEERKAEELKIAQEKLKLELAKSAKATETIKNEALTPEEREAKLKEIFGL